MVNPPRLKPCPAGHEGAEVSYAGYGQYQVFCGQAALCGWQGPKRDTEEEAIAAWNERA